MAIFGPRMHELVQPIRPPGQETVEPWLERSPGLEEGTGRGEGLMLGDVTPATWLPSGSPGSANSVSRDASSSLHTHTEGCFGAAGPPYGALFWPSMDEQVQPIRPLAPLTLGARLDPSPGQAEKMGGVDTRGRESQQHGCHQGPQLGQVRLLDSKQQSSRPL